MKLIMKNAKGEKEPLDVEIDWMYYVKWNAKLYGGLLLVLIVAALAAGNL